MFIIHKLLALVRKEGVLVILYILGLLLLTLILMPAFEGMDSPFGSTLNNFWWYFVTITTVGYGDISPVSSGGKIFAILIMLSGIGLAAGLITYVSTAFIERRRRFMKGQKQLNFNKHIVILGFHESTFAALVDEIFADEKRVNRPIILCTDILDENPIPEKIHFVKGVIHSADVIQKSCLADAVSIVINGQSDQENILTTLAAHHANPNAHIVTYIGNPENVQHIQRISNKISVVNPIAVPLIVQEMQDQGTLEVIYQLLTNREGSEIYRLPIPNNISKLLFYDAFILFKKRYNAILIGVQMDRVIINPADNIDISSGQAVYVICEDRPSDGVWKNYTTG